ncbi:hypothetical protein TNCV_2866961 [Trichonephila clavipes]|nr:hypothetical protein TNCV_2866961 [Trichonephila clavipes]
MMTPAYNIKGVQISIRDGNPLQVKRSPTSIPEENTTMPYWGFEPKPTRLQAEGHIHHTGWVALIQVYVQDVPGSLGQTLR